MKVAANSTCLSSFPARIDRRSEEAIRAGFGQRQFAGSDGAGGAMRCHHIAQQIRQQERRGANDQGEQKP